MPLNEAVLIWQAARIRMLDYKLVQAVERAIRQAFAGGNVADLVLMPRALYDAFADWDLDVCRDEVRKLLEQ